MSLGIFDALELGPAERLASEFIPSLVASGLSKNAIFDSIRQLAPDLTRVQSGSLVDYARSILNSSSEITSAARDEILNSSEFPPATSNILRNFNVRVSANVFDPELGEFRKQYITIATDTFTSKQVFLDQYSDIATAYFIDYAEASKGGFVNVQSLEIESVLKSPTLP